MLRRLKPEKKVIHSPSGSWRILSPTFQTTGSTQSNTDGNYCNYANYTKKISVIRDILGYKKRFGFEF
ncbi:MAG: hypothetical protein ACOCYO_09525 [Bacteroidota bacterium]